MHSSYLPANHRPFSAFEWSSSNSSHSDKLRLSSSPLKIQVISNPKVMICVIPSSHYSKPSIKSNKWRAGKGGIHPVRSMQVSCWLSNRCTQWTIISTVVITVHWLYLAAMSNVVPYIATMYSAIAMTCDKHVTDKRCSYDFSQLLWLFTYHYQIQWYIWSACSSVVHKHPVYLHCTIHRQCLKKSYTQ